MVHLTALQVFRGSRHRLLLAVSAQETERPQTVAEDWETTGTTLYAVYSFRQDIAPEIRAFVDGSLSRRRAARRKRVWDRRDIAALRQFLGVEQLPLALGVLSPVATSAGRDHRRPPSDCPRGTTWRLPPKARRIAITRHVFRAQNLYAEAPAVLGEDASNLLRRLHDIATRVTLQPGPGRKVHSRPFRRTMSAGLIEAVEHHSVDPDILNDV